MKVNVTVEVHRDDGTTLSHMVRAESERIWPAKGGGWSRETRQQLRARVDRMVRAAMNATMGR